MDQTKKIECKVKLQDFFCRESEIRELKSTADTENIAELAPLMRAGKCCLTFYETFQEEQKKEGHEVLYYDNGRADEERYVFVREVTDGGNVIIVKTWQCVKEPDWDESEKELVQVMNRMLFFCKSRIRVLKLLKQVTYYDEDMKIGNLKFGMYQMSLLLQQGCLGDYVAFFLNIRGMNGINDLVGFKQGTVIMGEFVKRISEHLQNPECVCRIGGDNFLVLAKKEKAEKVGDILQGQMIPYGNLPQEKVMVSAMAGAYMIPETVQTPYEVMNAISNAANIARYSKRVPILYYDDSLLKVLRHNRQVENDFSYALEQEEFHVYYQPKVSLNNYEVKGAEALCRWIKDDLIVPPDSFIPILEKSQKICELDFFMLEHVCRDMQCWMKEGRQVVKTSVNFSRRHLLNMELVDSIVKVIDRYEIPHELIEVEFTETTNESDFIQLKKVVMELKEKNITTFVDDFGTGYSSLSLIRDVPFKVLKIDKSFLQQDKDMFHRDNIMMKHVIGMANELGMYCIAEGVETMENVELLKENKCYLAQGYLFDKPLPKEEFEKRLDDGHYTPE